MTRVAIVTGAARGIGAATVDALVNDGYRVVAFDRCREVDAIPYAMATEAELTAVATRHGDHVVALVGDVRSAADTQLAVATAVDHFGGLDVVVAGAGVIAGGVRIDQMSDDAYDAVMSVNLLGVRRLLQAAVPAMVERGGGRVVAISSAASVQGLPLLAAYSAAKAAVVGLVRAAAVELAPLHITVNAVSPGSTRTAILDASTQIYGLRSREEFADQQPLGRLIDPSEVATAISWLCSPAASAITGVNLAVDGGMTLN
jgi:SDR family mycofactocin-dependent oxidoreductase